MIWGGEHFYTFTSNTIMGNGRELRRMEPTFPTPDCSMGGPACPEGHWAIPHTLNMGSCFLALGTRKKALGERSRRDWGPRLHCSKSQQIVRRQKISDQKVFQQKWQHATGAAYLQPYWIFYPFIIINQTWVSFIKCRKSAQRVVLICTACGSKAFLHSSIGRHSQDNTQHMTRKKNLFPVIQDE